MDSRYSSRRSRVGKHFRSGKYQPRTKKDWQKPKGKSAEDFIGKGRAQNKQTVEDTLGIIEEGGYEYIYGSDENPDSESIVVPLQADLKYARDNTVTYTSEQGLSLTQFDKAESKDEYPTIYEINKETTLVGCKGLVDEGYNVAVLNFASARNPGGGFINGSNTQE